MNHTQDVIGPRRVGGRYLSGYWGVSYEVTAIEGTWITCKWDDGRVTTHCTRWDPRRDRVLHT